MTNGKKIGCSGLIALAFMAGEGLGSFMGRSVALDIAVIGSFLLAWLVFVVDVFRMSKIDYRR